MCNDPGSGSLGGNYPVLIRTSLNVNVRVKIIDVFVILWILVSIGPSTC